LKEILVVGLEGKAFAARGNLHWGHKEAVMELSQPHLLQSLTGLDSKSSMQI
jgi:hypothetical protein